MDPLPQTPPSDSLLSMTQLSLEDMKRPMRKTLEKHKRCVDINLCPRDANTINNSRFVFSPYCLSAPTFN